MIYRALLLAGDGFTLGVLRSALKLQDFTVEVCATQQEFQRKLATEIPHLVVFDCDDAQGWRLRALREMKTGGYAKIPTLIVGEESMVRALAGDRTYAEDYFSVKPARFNRVSEKIALLLELVRQRPPHWEISNPGAPIDALLSVPVKLHSVSEAGLVLESDILEFRSLDGLVCQAEIFKEIGIASPALRYATGETGNPQIRHFKPMNWDEDVLARIRRLNLREAAGRNGMESEKSCKRFLILDDALESRVIASAMVRRLFPGSAIVAAATVKEAIESIRAATPDLVISDLYLQSDSGFDLLHTFPRKERNFPILVISFDHRDDVVERLLISGADDIMHKPLTMGELRQKLNALLRTAEPGSVAGQAEFGTYEAQLQFNGKVIAVSEREILFLSQARFSSGSKLKVAVNQESAEVEVLEVTEHLPTGLYRIAGRFLFGEKSETSASRNLLMQLRRT